MRRIGAVDRGVALVDPLASALTTASAAKASRMPASYQTSTFPILPAPTPPCGGEVRTMIACAGTRRGFETSRGASVMRKGGRDEGRRQARARSA